MLPDKSMNSTLIDRVTILAQSGHHADAIQIWCEAQNMDPAEPSGLFVLASLLIENNAAAAACEVFERVLSAAPAYHVCRYQYGFLLVNLGDLPAALRQFEYLEEQIDLPNFLMHFTNGFCVLLKNDDTDSAINLFRQGIESNVSIEEINLDIQHIIDLLRPEDAEFKTGLNHSLLLNVYNNHD